jgi:hypothetical protein
VPCFEKPERADFVYDAVKARNFGPILEPKEFPVSLIERVHAPRYIRFLEKAWDLWSAQGYTNDALPAVWPVRGFRSDIEPDHFAGKFGLYSYDSGTPPEPCRALRRDFSPTGGAAGRSAAPSLGLCCAAKMRLQKSYLPRGRPSTKRSSGSCHDSRGINHCSLRTPKRDEWTIQCSTVLPPRSRKRT